MRIGIDITSTQDQFAHRGIGKYTKNIVEQFLRAGTSYDFVVYRFDAPSTLDYCLQKREYSRKVQIVSLGHLRPSSPWELLHKRSYAKKIRRSHIDILFLPHIERGIVFGSFKTVVMIHDVIPLIERHFSEKGIIAGMIKERIYRKNLSDALKANLILTNSEFSKQQIEQSTKADNCHVVYLGIDERFFSIKRDRIIQVIEHYHLPSEYILYYGGNQGNKNVLGLLEMWKHYCSTYPDTPLQLVLAGKDFADKKKRENKEIMKAIMKMGLVGKIFFLQHFQEHDQPYILAGARCFVSSSTIEGFGFPVLEASAVGVPIIASDIPVYKETLGKTAFFVSFRDNQQAVDALERVVKLSALELKRIQQDELKNAQRFIWQDTAQKTLSYIDKL